MAYPCKRATAPHGSATETVVFNVGGKHFETLRFKIQAYPSTMLASLIDDIGTDIEEPIFVDANPDRFNHILDWYRYGEMFVHEASPVEAVLRDARYFLLPDNVKINGCNHTIGPCISSVASGHEKLRAEVVSKWPNFRAYVDKLAKEAMEAFHRQGENAEVNAPVTNISTHATVHFADAEETQWQKVQLSGRDPSQRNQIVWKDGENVCSMPRLRVLVQELCKLGFVCSIGTQDNFFQIDLDIGIPPCTKTCTDVRIQGIDIIRDGFQCGVRRLSRLAVRQQ